MENIEIIKKIIHNDNSNIRVYLLKKIGYKGQYEAVLFPNDIEKKIRETYAKNFETFCSDRNVTEYDCVHSEKDTIKKLSISDLSYWEAMLSAIKQADTERKILNKKNFTDDYSVIVLVYDNKHENLADRIYLVAQYRKVETWYKKSVLFGFVADTIKLKEEDIFVLNGCIDTAIIEEGVYVFQESSFEKVFNYYEKSKKIIEEKKEEIENWKFIDKPEEFYNDVSGKKIATKKLARALEKADHDYSELDPLTVKNVLSQYDEFSELKYDNNNKIIFSSSVRDLIIDIMRHTYARNLFSNNLVHTKGV